MADILQVLLIIIVMFYFYFHLDQKIEAVHKNIKIDNKSLNQKLTGLTQLLTSYLRQ